MPASRTFDYQDTFHVGLLVAAWWAGSQDVAGQAR
jgi:hypothetical protein